MKRFLSVVGLVLFLSASHASANVVFTFSGAMFSDGATLTGTFTTNDALTSLVTYDITTSGSTGFHYTPGTSDDSSTSLPFILVLNTPPSLDNILQVTFTGGLTSSGASILIGTNDSFEETTGTGRRDISAGSVIVSTAIPEPSTIALVGIALLALALLLRVRRRRDR